MKHTDNNINPMISSPLHSCLQVRILGALDIWFARADVEGPVPNRNADMIEACCGNCDEVRFGDP